jgi:hypothetical protein
VYCSAQRAELRALASVAAAALAELGAVAELGASTGDAAAIASGETDDIIGDARVLGGGGTLGPLARSAGGVGDSAGGVASDVDAEMAWVEVRARAAIERVERAGRVAAGAGSEVRARAAIERAGRAAAGAGVGCAGRVLGNGSGMVRRRPSSARAAAINSARASR